MTSDKKQETRNKGQETSDKTSLPASSSGRRQRGYGRTSPKALADGARGKQEKSDNRQEARNGEQ